MALFSSLQKSIEHSSSANVRDLTSPSGSRKNRLEFHFPSFSCPLWLKLSVNINPSCVAPLPQGDKLMNEWFFFFLRASGNTSRRERRKNRLFPTRERTSRAEARRQPIQARWGLTDKKPNRFGLLWMWPLVFLFSTRKCVAGCWELGGGTLSLCSLDEGQLTVSLPKICRNF